jgi:hypothetical protein
MNMIKMEDKFTKFIFILLGLLSTALIFLSFSTIFIAFQLILK